MVLGTGYRVMGKIDVVSHRDFRTVRGYEYKRVLHDKRIRSIHAMMQGAYDCTLGTPRSEVAFRILSAQPQIFFLYFAYKEQLFYFAVYMLTLSSISSITDRRKFVSSHIESLIFVFGRLPGPVNIRIVKPEKLRNLSKMLQLVSNKAWMEICLHDSQFSVPLTLPVIFAKTKPIWGNCGTHMVIYFHSEELMFLLAW